MVLANRALHKTDPQLSYMLARDENKIEITVYTVVHESPHRFPFVLQVRTRAVRQVLNLQNKNENFGKVAIYFST